MQQFNSAPGNIRGYTSGPKDAVRKAEQQIILIDQDEFIDLLIALV